MMIRYFAWAHVRNDERLSRWIRKKADGTFADLGFDIAALVSAAEAFVSSGEYTAPEDDQEGLTAP